jgi:ribosomal protein S18 acetylase RimI-like enzyme
VTELTVALGISEVRIREAVAADRGPLMSFVSKTWSWGDYIPNVWSDWFHDSAGKIFVAEIAGRQVGMNHVHIIDGNICWMEGVRVHPDFRRQGIATMLGRKSIEYGLRKGARTFRLLSGSENIVAHAQVAKLGFEEKAKFRFHRRGKASPPNKRLKVKKVKLMEADQVFRTIRKSAEYRDLKGFCVDDFVAYRLDKRRFTKYVKRSSVYRSAGDRGAAFGVYDHAEQWGQIIFLCGDAKAGSQIVLKALRDFKKRRLASYAFTDEGTSVADVLAKLGFEEDEGFILFETKRD